MTRYIFSDLHVPHISDRLTTAVTFCMFVIIFGWIVCNKTPSWVKVVYKTFSSCDTCVPSPLETSSVPFFCALNILCAIAKRGWVVVPGPSNGNSSSWKPVKNWIKMSASESRLRAATNSSNDRTLTSLHTWKALLIDSRTCHSVKLGGSFTILHIPTHARTHTHTRTHTHRHMNAYTW